MTSWLVLGCGRHCRSIVSDIAERADLLRVVEPDPERVELLRNRSIAAVDGSLDELESIDVLAQPDVVLVFGDDSTANLEAAKTARGRYPDAYLVAYPGENPSKQTQSTLQGLADQLISPGQAVLERIEQFVEGEFQTRTSKLCAVLESIPGTLGVFTHDTPDPDAIASAVGLVELAESVGTDAQACYYGDIAHQENKALVNVLGLELQRFDLEDQLEFDGYALVDHSNPGVNDQLPSDLPIDVIIDHHPTEAVVSARYVDLREHTGASSTLLTEHFHAGGLEPSEAVATALLYGIRIDTRNFVREVLPADFQAAAFVLDHADTAALETVESQTATAESFSTLANAIRNRTLDGSALATCVGEITARDALADAADRLLGMEGVSATLVFGRMDDTIYASARGLRHRLDIGTVLRAAFDGVGSAGGHVDMAGAQIPLEAIEANTTDPEPVSPAVVDAVTDRFFEALDSHRMDS